MLHEKARGDHEDGIDILSDEKGPKNTNMIDCFSLFFLSCFPVLEPIRTIRAFWPPLGSENPSSNFEFLALAEELA